MRRLVCWTLSVWLFGGLVLSAFWCLSPLVRAGSDCGHAELSRFVDFTMRMNEAECLRRGVDPYDVWSERVFMPPYFSNCHQGPVPSGCSEMTNAYVPWEYTVAIALSLLPRWSGWLVYCGLMLAAAVFVLLAPAGCSAVSDASSERWLASAAALSAVVYPLWSNAAVGNLAVFSLAGAVGMGWCLNRGRDVLAGFCWSLVMLKPQLGLTFSIPLLMRFKWKTCLVAVSACLVASIPPSLFCGKSFLAMIVGAPEASAFAYKGCGTWPSFLCGTLGPGLDIVMGTLVGALVCVWMTRTIQKDDDWYLFLMPAAIVSCCWTYTQAYSHVMGWFVAFVIARDLIRHPSSSFLRSLMILAFLSLSRWILAWHGLVAFLRWQFPVPDYAFRCADSLNSTVSLAIALAFCVRRGQK